MRTSALKPTAAAPTIRLVAPVTQAYVPADISVLVIPINCVIPAGTILSKGSVQRLITVAPWVTLQHWNT